MANTLFQMVYTSTAKELFSDDELLELLNTARVNNEKLGITGMLLYSEGVFMQALEGEKQAVMDLYDIISRDPRHHHSITMTELPITERQFSDWSMGFKSLSRQELAEKTGYTSFLSYDFDTTTLANTPSVAIKLLLSFRKNIA